MGSPPLFTVLLQKRSHGLVGVFRVDLGVQLVNVLTVELASV